MKIKKFQLRGSNSVCAVAFPLMRGFAPALLRGNIGSKLTSDWFGFWYGKPTYRKSRLLFRCLICSILRVAMLQVLVYVYKSFSVSRLQYYKTL
jgi:hypothetical protein